MDNNMIQNNIRRAEELKKITSSVIKLRAELENVNQALQKLINKEIQEIEEEDRYWQQQADLEKESA
jgi:CII-binding regulator of phage lambda lysogenization HflD